MRDNDWRKSRYEKAKREEEFVMSALTIAIGGACSGCTLEDDMKSHIDLWWDSSKRGVIGIDVKGIKAHSTSAHTFDEGIQWLELTNTTGGTGWLRGKAEYIAFKGSKDVFFVKRQKLLDWTLKMIEGKELTTELPKAFYTPYRRAKWGNLDIVCKCPTSDLRKLASWTIDNKWYNDIMNGKEQFKPA